MSRRSVIRCDECGADADMRFPAWMSSTSATMEPAGPLFGRSTKPEPPDGWFERYAGLRGQLDFCSPACVQAWDAKQPTRGLLG